MSDLPHILNPEGGKKRSIKLILNSNDSNKQSASNHEPPVIGLDAQVDAPEIAQAETNTAFSNGSIARDEHETHPDCPDKLACLPDTNGRPQHTLPVILRCAILGSSKKRLTIREIYAAMEEKYPYFKTAGPTWKQSVRHHLSLNRLFERQPRPVTDPGFGSYWTVNLEAPPGTKRPRKRGRNKSSTTELNEPKKRGRPPKSSLIPDLKEPSPSSHEEDCEDMKFRLKLVDGYNVSEDDYESEEDLVRPYDRRNSLTGLTPYVASQPPQPFTLPPFSSIDTGPEDAFERMQLEISNLRKQSAEVVSNSLRLSEQLAHAKADASRTRLALKSAEEMLEHETQRRRDAERLADEEAVRRRNAEQALNNMTSTSRCTQTQC
ncbi:hypothetical protein BDQ17DRAFT_1295653 [Cyathus striatus]|nr:hypothetical protein BDQ17DRAFT_1295653 [Cyathus striatus]